MMKWGLILVIIGAVIAVLFLFLPLYAPDNAVSKLYLAPLLCRSGETYVSDTDFGTGFKRAPTASLNAYCVSASGERRSVTDSHVMIAIVGGGIPFALGMVMVLIARFVAEFKSALGMKRTSPTPYNPTTPTLPDEQLGKSAAPAGLSERLAEVDAAYRARRISRDDYEAQRKKIIDEATS